MKALISNSMDAIEHQQQDSYPKLKMSCNKAFIIDYSQQSKQLKVNSQFSSPEFKGHITKKYYIQLNSVISPPKNPNKDTF